MKKIFALVTFVMLVVNPIISQTKAEKKAAKEAVAIKEYEAMKALINSESYTFEGEWATSNRGRRINLMSNPTFIKMEAKNADAFLPFFGTAHSGAGYGSSNGGIEFKGEVQDYQVNFNDKKKRATIKYKTKSKSSENFDVTITIHGSTSANVNINSSNRSTMNYSGEIKKLEKKKE